MVIETSTKAVIGIARPGQRCLPLCVPCGVLEAGVHRSFDAGAFVTDFSENQCCIECWTMYRTAI